jgi:hypothetical protein
MRVSKIVLGRSQCKYSGASDDSLQMMSRIKAKEELVLEPTPGKLEAQLTAKDTIPT